MYVHCHLPIQIVVCLLLFSIKFSILIFLHAAVSAEGAHIFVLARNFTLYVQFYIFVLISAVAVDSIFTDYLSDLVIC